MLKRYDIIGRSVVQSEDDRAPIHFYVNPDENEKQRLQKTYDIDEHTIMSALDVDEVSRIEFESDRTFIIWKRPQSYLFTGQPQFNVSSMGIMLFKDRMIVIAPDDFPLSDRKEFNRVNSVFDFFLKMLSFTIHHYLEHLKIIKLMSREIQEKINSSLENEYLIQMFNLGESLVYYFNAISANTSVVTKLRNNVQRISCTEEEIELIDDILIENTQCSKQAEIYSTVLSGLMDARGSLVNNNMNVLLRKLTIINIIFLPLNLIASIGGMSEYSMMTSKVPWPVAYALFGASMIALGWLTAYLLNKVNSNTGSHRSHRRITAWFKRYLASQKNRPLA